MYHASSIPVLPALVGFRFLIVIPSLIPLRFSCPSSHLHASHYSACYQYHFQQSEKSTRTSVAVGIGTVAMVVMRNEIHSSCLR